MGPIISEIHDKKSEQFELLDATQCSSGGTLQISFISFSSLFFELP